MPFIGCWFVPKVMVVLLDPKAVRRKSERKQEMRIEPVEVLRVRTNRRKVNGLAKGKAFNESTAFKQRAILNSLYQKPETYADA